MADRHVYLKIEEIASYNPVNPEPKPAPPRAYQRDCMMQLRPPPRTAAGALSGASCASGATLPAVMKI